VLKLLFKLFGTDIVLYLCERGHVERGMVFQLLEDLTEVSTIKDCKEVFGYIEGKQETLGKVDNLHKTL
jgi:THO complex subunit 1